jgi:hypothetical protein
MPTNTSRKPHNQHRQAQIQQQTILPGNHSNKTRQAPGTTPGNHSNDTRQLQKHYAVVAKDPELKQTHENHKIHIRQSEQQLQKITGTT